MAIAGVIYDVWLERAGKATRWRGGGARSLRQELRLYGLPDWSMYVVGTLKVGTATLLLLGLEYPAVTRPAALTMATLMAGAVAMHFKVKDPLKRALPALTMLALSLGVAKYAGTKKAPRVGHAQASMSRR